MTLPCRGRDCGTTTWKCTVPPSPARSRTRSSRFLPPIVSFARTRTFATGSDPLVTLGRLGAGRLLGPRLFGRLEDAVHRAGHAVLVRAADDRRHGIEV